MIIIVSMHCFNLQVIASTSLDDLKAVFNEDGPRMLLMECGYFAPYLLTDYMRVINELIYHYFFRA